MTIFERESWHSFTHHILFSRDKSFFDTMAACRIAIQGHSFITRLESFIFHNSVSFNFNFNLDANEFSFAFFGRPGGKIHHLYADILDQAHIVILQIGSNDLTNFDISPGQVAIDIFNYAQHIIHSGVQHVICLQILHRLPSSKHRLNTDVFNDRVNTNYMMLKDLFSNIPHVTFWKHKGLFEHSTLQNALSSDGVHLNHKGYKKYFRNIRAAIIAVYNKFFPHLHFNR